MTPDSPTPRRIQPPRWLDLRLVLGVVLVLGSVAIGAVVVSSADSTVPMLAATRNLAAGSVLASADVQVVRVRLSDGASRYFGGAVDLSGKQLSRDISSGELLPRDALLTAAPSTTVSIPFQSGQAPPLQRGERLQIWISTKTCPAQIVVNDVTVQQVQTASGGLAADGGQTAVIQAPAKLAQRIITALGVSGATLRAGVLSGAATSNANDSLPDLSPCSGGGA